MDLDGEKRGYVCLGSGLGQGPDRGQCHNQTRAHPQMKHVPSASGRQISSCWNVGSDPNGGGGLAMVVLSDALGLDRATCGQSHFASIVRRPGSSFINEKVTFFRSESCIPLFTIQ